MTRTLLVKNATRIAAFDDAGNEFIDAGLFARNGVIEAIGPAAMLPPTADEIIDASDHLILPGLINTHHHLYQTLTRALAPNADLFTWLKTLYPIWARLTAEGVYVSTKTGLAELLLSGCTTSSDHLYLFPNDTCLDAQIEAAQEMGVRFHAARGAMSLGQSAGGLPPDSVTEDEDAILADCERVIRRYHERQRFAMMRIVLAPCSPFSVTPKLMRDTAALARREEVRLHTHLAETLEEEQFCLEHFGQRPAHYAKSLGWTGSDVWYAHCVHLNPGELKRLGRDRTGVAHCPTSNMRLASGIAPVPAMQAAGIPVGLGVDGAASNDGGQLLAEARMAMLLQRVAPDRYGASEHGGRSGFAGNAAACDARTALHLATRGGAAVLGRDDIGQLAPHKAADFIAIDLNRIEFAGAQHDPVAAAIFTQPVPPALVVVNGKVVVRDYQLLTLDVDTHTERHNRIATEMLRGQ